MADIDQIFFYKRRGLAGDCNSSCLNIHKFHSHPIKGGQIVAPSVCFHLKRFLFRQTWVLNLAKRRLDKLREEQSSSIIECSECKLLFLVFNFLDDSTESRQKNSNIDPNFLDRNDTCCLWIYQKKKLWHQYLSKPFR